MGYCAISLNIIKVHHFLIHEVACLVDFGGKLGNSV